ncbi:MAG: hypothetical protein JXB85_11750, partial [Anaerolineales bacterium]|nr:hypothetical protein [Anaerolineales bacterium]
SLTVGWAKIFLFCATFYQNASDCTTVTLTVPLSDRLPEQIINSTDGLGQIQFVLWFTIAFMIISGIGLWNMKEWGVTLCETYPITLALIGALGILGVFLGNIVSNETALAFLIFLSIFLVGIIWEIALRRLKRKIRYG